MDDLPLSSGLPQPEREKAPVDYDRVRATYNREDMLGVRQKLLSADWTDKKVPADMKGLRTLMVPKMATSSGHSRRKRESDSAVDRSRDKVDDEQAAFEGGRRKERDYSPLKEAPQQHAVTPQKDKITAPASGEEKKANCPTQ